MFACFPCSFQTEVVSEFEEHLRAKHKPKQEEEEVEQYVPEEVDCYDPNQGHKSYKCSQCPFEYSELDVVAKHFIESHQQKSDQDDETNEETLLFVDNSQVTIAHIVDESDQSAFHEDQIQEQVSLDLEDKQQYLDESKGDLQNIEEVQKENVEEVKFHSLKPSKINLRNNLTPKVKRDLAGDEDEEDEFGITGFEPIIQIRVENEQMKEECANFILESAKKRRHINASKKLKILDQLDSDLQQPETKKRGRRKKIPKIADEPVKLEEPAESDSELPDGFEELPDESEMLEDDDDDDDGDESADEPEIKKEGQKRGPKKKTEEGTEPVVKGRRKRGRKRKPDSEKTIYQCPNCIKVFKNRCDMQRHVSNIHLKLKPFECDRCHRTFGLLGNLKKHIDIVHYNKKRMNTKAHCQICGHQYSSNHSLNLHMSSVHAQEKRFQCEYCGMKFGWSGCYERHIKSVHLQEKNYKCDVCGTAFARKEHLRAHSKRHAPKDSSSK